ncbi:MAG: 50S ribosomal protein L21e [Candidatus Micrarchaeota archaeon]
MVKPSKGAFSKRTRQLRGKSRTSVAKLVQKFNVGDKVIISPMAKYTGLPHLRYTGKHGVVIEKRGRGYVVKVRDFKTTKDIVVGAVHLKLSG